MDKYASTMQRSPVDNIDRAFLLLLKPRKLRKQNKNERNSEAYDEIFDDRDRYKIRDGANQKICAKGGKAFPVSSSGGAF